MKRIFIFGKTTCSVCKDAYDKIRFFKENRSFDAEIKYFDMDSIDGMAEGAFYEVTDVPTVMILDDQKQELVRWVKKPPISEEFLPYLKP